MPAVLTESTDQIFFVTLNRPEARNAWNDALVEGLREAWIAFEKSDDRVCIVRANGPHFSSGLDLKSPPKEGISAFPNLFVKSKKPIIASVEGKVLGVAGGFVMMSDMVFAGSDATFAYLEARVGYFKGVMGGFSGRLQHKAGLQWIMTGDTIDANRAREIGLINEVTEPGGAFKRSMEVARRIADNAPLVIQAMKALAQATVPQGPVEIFYEYERMLSAIKDSEDGKEGLAAMREKRKPKFKGL